MSEDTKSKVDQYTNLFFKGLWIVITYFLMDTHGRVKDMEKDLHDLQLNYTENKAEIRYRVQAAEDNIKLLRLKASYINSSNKDDNAGQDH